MIEARRIVVLCSTSATGGPELLHQLVSALRQDGHDAYICYYPFDQPFECHEIYRKYQAPQIQFSDDPDTFYVVPEAATWLAKHISSDNIAIWWMSVDNYFCLKHQSWINDLYRRYKSLLRHRLPLARLRRYRHFAQSKYAVEFLAKAGIESYVLSDYLGSEHLVPRDLSLPREDIVAYNPKKGAKQTAKLRELNPHIRFVPIENMTPRQVAELLETAKIYIDFGHHPGKDRPPREAAMAGCCVITGRRGAARYYEDVPIPDAYKLDDAGGEYLNRFRPLADAIFASYLEHARNFDHYRQVIAAEPELFRQQVKAIFPPK